MRKILFSAIALLISATMLAVGTGDGKSQSNAIDFDWGSAYIHEANNTLWYSVGLSGLSEEANNPTLALYLTNLTADQANVTLSAKAVINLPLLGALELSVPPTGDGTVNYNIVGKGHEIWTLPTTFDLTEYADSQPILKKVFADPSNVSLAELREFGLDDVYLQVASNKQIAIATKVYEQEEIIDDACTEAVAFEWTGESVAAGEKWFYLNLSEVKASNEKLNFVVENNGSAVANVAFDLYLDCPASAIVLDYDWTIAVDGQQSEALGRFLLNQIAEDFVYLHLTTDQAITLKAEKEVLPPPTPADDLFDATSAPVMGDKISLNNEAKVVKVVLDDLKAPKGYKTICHIINHSSAEVTLKQEVAFEPLATIHNTDVKNLVLAANTKVDMPISGNMLDNIKSDAAHFRLTANGQVTIMFEQVPVEAPATKPEVVAPACDESYVFDWNSTIKQKAFRTKWYELDIAPLKQNDEQVQLTFTNHSDSMVVVLGSILLDCDSKDTIPYALPIPAGKSVSQLINYNLLTASLLERIYVSVTMVPTTIDALSDITSIRDKEDVKDLLSFNTNAEIEISATKSSALVDPTLCNTNETLQQGVKYTQAAGTTKWYRVTEDFIKNDLGLLSSLTIENQGSKAANVTLGATIACDYGVVSSATITIPTWFDLTSIIPSGAYYLIDKLTNKEITEFYIEVTTDQPIMFGFGVEYGNAFGCDDATVFDWATGTTIPANDAKWYKFDVTDLKANEEQVKLTFTNTADSIAWVAAFLTHECPFYVGLPMVFPVPAGASVDKWIDYSFIASTPINTVYMAVYTDSNIEIKAEKETAKITPAIDCTEATIVEPNILYTVQPGTSWYKFSAEPFINTVDTHARISFANKSGKTAHVTTGATVGCEYGILTRGKLPVPAMDVDVNIPTWVFGVLSKFVDEDVNQYYVEVTTDEPLQFQIEMEMACTDPVYVTDSIAEVLCPGTEFVNPYTNDTLVFAIDTVIVDTVETEDPCTFNVHVITLTTMPREFVLDTTYVYWCEGKEFVHPVTGVVTTIFEDTTFVDTLATATPCVDSIVVYVVAPVKAPKYLTKEILDSIGALPVLAPGYKPNITGTITKILQYYADNDSETVADVSDVTWEGADVVIDCAATKHKMKLVVTAECENVMTIPFTFDVTPTATSTKIEKKTICYGGSYTWPINGQSYATTDVHKYTEPSTITGCDSVYHELHLTVLPDVQNLPVEKKTICHGGSYPWNGQTCNESKTYTHVVKNSLGCDSLIYTLELTVLPDVVTLPVEEKTICHGESYPWNGQDCNESKTYTHVVRNSLGCDSLIYTLELTVMAAVELPATANVQELILVLCGKTANVAEAEAYVKAYVEAVELAPAIESIVWEQKVDGQWVSLQPTDGTDDTVVVRYTLNTACEDVTSEEMTIAVEKPTYENDPDMDNIVPIYSKYGNRLLTVDLVYIKENYSWDVMADDVTWYNGDQVVGTGFYLTKEDGTPLPAGKYYARIDHTRINPEACDGTIQTQSVTVEEANKAPKLMPTVARPQELIRVLNLNADAVSTISIYSTTGDLISTFQVTNQEETTFPAAELTGYYVVDVQTETEKVSLRYVVK